MAFPAYGYRDYGGGATPSGIVAALPNTYSTGQIFTIANGISWVNLNGNALGSGDGVSTQGPFVVAVDYGAANEEKILCSSIATTTGVVTVWTDGTNNGRGYDGTTAQAHTIGALCTPVFSATEADEANNVAYEVLGQVTAAGDMLVGSGVKSLAKIAAGTASTVWTSNGAGATPSWQAPIAQPYYSASTSPPSSPVQGQLWYQTDTGLIKVYSAGAWVVIPTTPSGTISDFAGASAPTGYLLCDGASVLRASYPNLFSAIGTTWGSADGTHFNVPDLRGRTVIGAGTGTGLTARTLGTQNIGEETHLLTGAESGTSAHGHTGIAHTHPGELNNQFLMFNNTTGGGTFASPGGGTGEGVAGQTGGATAGVNNSTQANAASAHNNMQPSAVVNKIIKI